MNHEFDTVILGTGPASSRVISLCAESRSIAVVEAREPGGTCALRGCNPKKVLVRATELIDWMNRAPFRGNAPQETLSWKSLQAFKEEFVAPVPEKTRTGLRNKNIPLFEGEGHFVDPETLCVGDATLKAKNFVVATGARPAPLSVPGSEYIIDSDAFLSLSELPRRILFIGGGFISFEFAHVAARAGSECTIIDRSVRPLKAFDGALVDRLVEYTESISVTIHRNTSLRSVKRSKKRGFHVEVSTTQGKARAMEVDLVVHGAGRVPKVDGLALEKADIRYGDAGITVNKYLQSVSNPRVFAAGDVADTGVGKLSPVANQEGRVIAKNILEGRNHTPDYGFVPTVLFTVPPLAAIGMTHEQAHDSGRCIRLLEGDRTRWASMRRLSIPCAAYRIVVDRETDVILGAHLLGPDAAETINLFAIAMKFGHTAKEMKSVLFAYPSCSSDVRTML